MTINTGYTAPPKWKKSTTKPASLPAETKD
jgi:hypothetical protein